MIRLTIGITFCGNEQEFNLKREWFEDRRQNPEPHSEPQTPNPELQTPNSERSTANLMEINGQNLRPKMNKIDHKP
jgi:hypothetical protein